MVVIIVPNGRSEGAYSASRSFDGGWGATLTTCTKVTNLRQSINDTLMDSRLWVGSAAKLILKLEEQ